MAKRITICAGIDTGKRKLDVALDGSREQLQVNNTSEGHEALLDWLRGCEFISALILRSARSGARVSKDGSESVLCGHPSRRIRFADAPQDEGSNSSLPRRIC